MNILLHVVVVSLLLYSVNVVVLAGRVETIPLIPQFTSNKFFPDY